MGGMFGRSTREGLVSLGFGVLIAAIGIAITAATKAAVVAFGAVLVGGGFIVKGVFQTAAGMLAGGLYNSEGGWDALPQRTRGVLAGTIVAVVLGAVAYYLWQYLATG